MSEQDHAGGKRSAVGKLVGDVAHMPFWQKGLLILATLVGVVGVAGQVTSRSNPTRPGQTPADNPSASPEGRRGFVAGSPQATSPETAVQEPEKSWFDRVSPTMTKSGIGFVGAFLVGWAFRVFLKTMAVITAIGIAILLALSYYNVINIDMSAAKQQWASASEWLGTQATHLKDLAIAHLPASSSSAAGLAVGLWKK